MQIASFSFLLCITRREQIAQIFGKPIYIIRDVTILPLSTQAEADQAITQARAGLQKARAAREANLASSESEESEYESLDDHAVGDPPEAQIPADERPQIAGRSESTTSVVQDVIERKGQYGQFASQWFSRRGWGLDHQRVEGTSTEKIQEIDQQQKKPQPHTTESISQGDPLPTTVETLGQSSAVDEVPSSQRLSQEAAIQMLPKILRTTKLLFTTQNFYFSYDFNISTRFGILSSPASLKSVSYEEMEQDVREMVYCSHCIN